MIKKTIKILILSILAVLPAPIFILAQLSPGGLPTYRPPASVTISTDGNAKAENVVVFQIIGNTFFARTYWNEAYVKWTIRTASSTQMVKKYGGVANISDIAVGHILNVEGQLLSGADSLNLNATSIRDLSLQVEDGSFSGKVTKVDNGVGNFVMLTNSGLSITVKTGGISIKKGVIFIPLSKIVAGDKILSVVGNYTPADQTIVATNVEVYQTPSLFAPRNFEGKLKSVSGTNLPSSVVITVGSVDYTVVLPSNTVVLTAKRKNVSLGRFLVGDTVRFYGAIRPAEQTTVDAEVIRNLNL